MISYERGPRSTEPLRRESSVPASLSCSRTGRRSTPSGGQEGNPI